MSETHTAENEQCAAEMRARVESVLAEMRATPEGTYWHIDTIEARIGAALGVTDDPKLGQKIRAFMKRSDR